MNLLIPNAIKTLRDEMLTIRLLQQLTRHHFQYRILPLFDDKT